MARNTNAGIKIAPGITAVVDENQVVLTMDASQDLGPSKSGKNRIVASTRGFVTLPNGQRLSLNLTGDLDEDE